MSPSCRCRRPLVLLCSCACARMSDPTPVPSPPTTPVHPQLYAPSPPAPHAQSSPLASLLYCSVPPSSCSHLPPRCPGRERERERGDRHSVSPGSAPTTHQWALSLRARMAMQLAGTTTVLRSR
ncbi:hypothetical protein CALCODRAFT_496344 [Calocera cornea HHB12733]|uniref:Secreted protein n=1 Tax=Calocera cornea HHB12733 TaxID=1353952 RepID=A0A165FUS3_9BASI|nr:hypothetical protein CALCODRAFT_496344 [Calocera cornea HHB12733]